jgi:hypothetical protein
MSRASISATTRLPRSVARRKTALACPCSPRFLLGPGAGPVEPTSRRQTHLELLAGDAVVVAVEAPVVEDREQIEPRTPFEVRHRLAICRIVRLQLPDAVRGYRLLTAVLFFTARECERLPRLRLPA